MKLKHLWILLPLALGGLVLWVVLTTPSKEQRRVHALSAECEAVVVGTVEETLGRRVKYRVEEVLKGVRVDSFVVEFSTDHGFAVGTRHLLFVRKASYGVAGGFAKEDVSNAMDPKHAEYARKRITGN